VSNALSLLITQEDWPKYQAMYAEAGGFAVNQIGWGSGPTSYPCLAASFTQKGSALLGAKKVVSCYVYVSDAQKLLEMAQMKSVTASQTAGVSPSQADFNKAMMAHVMTLIDTIVKSGLCKTEQYETWFASMLTKADQMSMEDMETIVRSIREGTSGDEEKESDD
jgi:hypothetical protein